MKVTIKDVAKQAGVSVATVSFVLNNTNRVGKKTCEKVLQIVKDLHYIPNAIAKSLVSKKTNDIALIISGPDYEYLSSSYLSALVTGIKSVCEQNNYHLIIKTMVTEDEFSLLPQELLSDKYDGILLWGIRMPEFELSILIQQSPLPLVSIARYLSYPFIYSVTVNDFQGAYMMTEYMINKGHSRILYLGVLPNVSTGALRHQGYLSALEEYNIKPDPKLQISCNFYQKEAYLTMIDILKNQLDFSSVFAASDTMALGAIQALYENNIKIPKDIAVGGFDNIPNSHLFITPLTTIQTPIQQLGELSFQKLVDIINGKIDIPYHSQLGVDLVIRKSV